MPDYKTAVREVWERLDFINDRPSFEDGVEIVEQQGPVISQGGILDEFSDRMDMAAKATAHLHPDEQEPKDCGTAIGMLIAICAERDQQAMAPTPVRWEGTE